MNIAQGYQWATHQPLIRAVMEVYKPKYVLELGAGIYSTPVFLEYKTKFRSIENNLEWIDYMQETFNIPIDHHHLADINEGTAYNELTADQIKQIVSYYVNLSVPKLHPRLLFVDQWMSCRMLSINVLRMGFELIIYHDSESIDVNSFHLINTTGYTVHTLKTSGPYTTLMAKENKDISEAIKPHIENFLKTYSECTLMELI